MSLINCPECDDSVSDQAVACPNCGFVLRDARKQSEQVTNLAAIGLVFGIGSTMAIAATAYLVTDSALLGFALLTGGVWFCFYQTMRRG